MKEKVHQNAPEATGTYKVLCAANHMPETTMTKQEAMDLDRLIRRHIFISRHLLADLRRGGGWRALGYPSFGEYGRKMTDIVGNRFYQVVKGAEIAQALGYGIENAEMTPDEGYMRPLRGLPPHAWREVWESTMAKAREEGKRLTKERLEVASKAWLAQHNQRQTADEEER